MLFLYPSRFRGCAEFEFPCHYSKKKNQSSDLLINRLMPFRLLHQLTQRIIEIVPLKKKKMKLFSMSMPDVVIFTRQEIQLHSD